MNWLTLKGVLSTGLSTYTGKQTVKMRRGKYLSGDNYRDGYIAMLYETIQELTDEDTYYPLDLVKTRDLIFAFNKLTAERVPDVWT